MRSVTVPTPGGPHALTITESPMPVAQPDEIVVEVHAAGVNRADVLQRQGHYNPPKGATPVLGLEASGTVYSVGEAVTDWTVGQRVAVLLTGGGYAQYVAVPAGQVLPVPDGMSLRDAAALPEVTATVYSNVAMAAGLGAGEWLLVHGGGSGIGSMAIQIARLLGAQIAVTVGSDEKAQRCADLGAHATINYRTEDFVERTREITGGGANVILDIIGAKYLERNLQALAPDGRLVIIGMQGGVKAELNLGLLLTGRKSVMGTTLRARPAEQKAEIIRQVRTHVWPAVCDGTITPIVDSTFSLDDIALAHERMEASSHFGKIIIEVSK